MSNIMGETTIAITKLMAGIRKLSIVIAGRSLRNKTQRVMTAAMTLPRQANEKVISRNVLALFLVMPRIVNQEYWLKSCSRKVQMRNRKIARQIT